MEATLIRNIWNTYDKFTPHSMRTWVKELHAYAEVPSGFQPHFHESAEPFPYTLLLPPETISPFHKRAAQLVCLYADRLVILEAKRDQVASTCYPLETIMQLEHGKVLLSSWLKISTQTGSTALYYNTVSEELFKPIIRSIRRQTGDVEATTVNPSQYQQERVKFGHLQRLNFKYMNYGANSLMPGDVVRSMIYQPEMCLKTVKFLNRTMFQHYALPHLTILTDRELILLKESKPARMRHETMYGGVLTYIPCQQIQQLDFRPLPVPQRVQMTVTLVNQSTVSAEFSADHPEVEAFQQTWAATSRALFRK